MERRILRGVAVSAGLAHGRARPYGAPRLEPAIESVAEETVPAEIARLEQALAAARGELLALRERLSGALHHELGDFFDAHALLLEDPELHQGLVELIRKGRMSARSALRVQRDRLAGVFAEMEDPYLRSRFEDVEHAIARVAACLHRAELGEGAGVAGGEGTILVAETVPPAELAHLAERGLKAVVTEQGSPLSHTAILARGLGLPMIVQVRGALAAIGEEDPLLVDAERGLVVVHPTPADLARLSRRRRSPAARPRRRELAPHACRSRDGVEIGLQGNAESIAELDAAIARGAAGIGLYRTEFLFLRETQSPDEESQHEAYAAAVRAADGRPVTFRTLDLGADKLPGGPAELPREENPALGLRGIRRSLADPEGFLAQLRAILRAGALGPVRVLLPMVTTARELEAARALLRRAAGQLRRARRPFAAGCPLGAMIEVPAAALAPEPILARADFVAIGSNDLMQYLLAADRGHDRLAGFFDPMHPALVRILARLIAACDRARRPVTLCGELAAETRHTPLLLALGLRAFSVRPEAIPRLRARIARLEVRALRALRPALLAARDRDTVARLLRQAGGG